MALIAAKHKRNQQFLPSEKKTYRLDVLNLVHPSHQGLFSGYVKVSFHHFSRALKGYDKQGES